MTNLGKPGIKAFEWLVLCDFGGLNPSINSQGFSGFSYTITSCTFIENLYLNSVKDASSIQPKSANCFQWFLGLPNIFCHALLTLIHFLAPNGIVYFRLFIPNIFDYIRLIPTNTYGSKQAILQI